MFAVFLILLLIAVVCGFLGAIIKGLFWLLIIGCVVFCLAMVFAGIRLGRRLARHDRERAARKAAKHENSPGT